jgi:hypothetical protein
VSTIEGVLEQAAVDTGGQLGKVSPLKRALKGYEAIVFTESPYPRKAAPFLWCKGGGVPKYYTHKTFVGKDFRTTNVCTRF